MTHEDRCARCDGPLEPGQAVQWVKGLTSPHRAHTACLGPYSDTAATERPTPEHQLVDALVTTGLQLDPLADWCLYVPAEVSLLLPRDDPHQLHRYRGREVISFPMTHPVVILSASSTPTALHLDLTTGTITHRPCDSG